VYAVGVGAAAGCDLFAFHTDLPSINNPPALP
jgi:hypothetical protein